MMSSIASIRTIISIAIVMVTFTLSASDRHHFSLIGEINIDSGTAILIPIADTSYYYPSTNKPCSFKGGHFIINGQINYPSAYKIGVKQNSEWIYISDIFFIEAGEQAIKCNIDSSREIPQIENESTRIWREYLSKMRYSNQNNVNADSILFQFTSRYPNSFVALWLIIDKLPNGYRAIYDPIFSLLAPSVKHSKPAKMFKNKLAFASQLREGSIFPRLTLADTAYRTFSVPHYPLEKRYTLIDFWFSHCTPCVGQFPKFAELYAKYRNEFEIIAISTDKQTDRIDWKRLIIGKELNWPQYLDTEKNAEAFSIHRFPTNFLLDENGKILKRDVSVEELRKLLNKVNQ